MFKLVVTIKSCKACPFLKGGVTYHEDYNQSSCWYCSKGYFGGYKVDHLGGYNYGVKDYEELNIIHKDCKLNVKEDIK